MRRAAVLVASWAALTGLYLLFVSTISGPEVAVGAGCGAAATTVGLIGLRVTGLTFRPDVRWLRWAVWLPVDVVRDTGRVAGLVWRRLAHRDATAGGFRTLTLPAQPDRAAEAARNAFVTALVSLSPGSYVVRLDPGNDEALVHAIAPPGHAELLVERAARTSGR